MNYFIITFGCQMNKSDSEKIASVLENLNYTCAQKQSEADLIVINMCSVRQSAVDRVYGLANKFREMKRQKKNDNLKTILTGCLLKSDFRKFRNSFDYILPIKTLEKWPEILRGGTIPYYKNPRELNFAEYLNRKSKHSTNFSVFIPISSGCDNFCSFCAVPYARGSLICRDHQKILNEIRFLVGTGTKEIWLLGQNVNDYQSPTDSEINFPKLLKMVNDVPGNFWIRFTSPHPKNFSDELIKTMAKCEKVTPYLNLPIQSGDDEILKRMNRPYTLSKYINLIKRIRAAFKKYREGLEKEIAISTDVIVGFPGETKRQFNNTIKLFKQMKFDMAYIAQYSPRPGTAASKLRDNVSLEEKERRWKILTDILKESALEKNKNYIGKEVEVLVDEKKNGFLIGKTRHYKTTKFKSDKNLVGQFAKTKIVNALHWGLKGKLV